ncbi:hypothetical protein ZIOFF_030818 [Zingiber officinale]|uniref:Uncharacterized protein n=1 Tax=Zingiber officinale TaxID=94328 RepID=A0A8J5H5E6_ZINOF|nr:hypothetical protein ZIOFF_030818 [Zingiber officinale]
MHGRWESTAYTEQCRLVAATTSTTAVVPTVALCAVTALAASVPSLAFGADQFDRSKSQPDADDVRVLQTFFNWYYVSVGISLVLALTVIIYIQDHAGWRIGLGVPVALMAVSTLFFLLGSAMYIKVKPNKSVLSGLAQVAVVAIKNRNIILPPNSSDSWPQEEGLQAHGAFQELEIPEQSLRHPKSREGPQPQRHCGRPVAAVHGGGAKGCGPGASHLLHRHISWRLSSSARASRCCRHRPWTAT